MSECTRIDSIKVEGRHRRDFGDIDSLAASIADVGLLQPVVITSDLRLIAGERRLRAVQTLGWPTIPTRIAANLTEAADLLRAERDENTCRKAMNPVEEHSIYAALLELEKPKAAERKAEAGASAAPGRKSEKVSHSFSPPKRAKTEAAKPLARSPKTLDKVGEVLAAIESPETPEPVREVAKAAVRDMESTGRVDGAYNRVKDAQHVAAQPKPSPAVSDYLAKDTKLQDLEYVKNFNRALGATFELTKFDADRLANLLEPEHITILEGHLKSLTKFTETIARGRRGLRLIEGRK